MSPDDSQDYFPITTSATRGLKLELENLNRQVFGQNFQSFSKESHIAENDSPEIQESNNGQKLAENTDKNPYIQLDVDAIEVCDTGQEMELVKMRKAQRDNEEIAFNRFSVASSTNNDVFIWQNPLHASSDFLSANLQVSPNQVTPDEQTDIEYDGEIIEMDHGKKSVTPIRLVRKNCDGQRSKRSSTIIPDSDSEDSDENWNYKLNANNPFFEQIQQLTASKQAQSTTSGGDMINSCEEASETIQSNNDSKSDATLTPNDTQTILATTNSNTRCMELPSPTEFGGGNPFLMFLCLTILLQHRDYIMQNNLDYNEMAMHFDKMVRKHNVNKVLSQARRLYQDYLRHHNEKMKNSNNNK